MELHGRNERGVMMSRCAKRWRTQGVYWDQRERRMRHDRDKRLRCAGRNACGATSPYRWTGSNPPSGFVAGSGKTVRDGLSRRADFSYWQCY